MGLIGLEGLESESGSLLDEVAGEEQFADSLRVAKGALPVVVEQRHGQLLRHVGVAHENVGQNWGPVRVVVDTLAVHEDLRDHAQVQEAVDALVVSLAVQINFESELVRVRSLELTQKVAQLLGSLKAAVG